ncbi:hypothetical protein BDW31_1372 [Staphylococcus sp. AtHG25]|uniref:hypothetical protein n=1 Tax=Staphylococcus sp. AtHG25 TaxID=1938895 RepID=UPI000D904F63|nr:hypothetical protein [Staphylococcus sp. AtHG25]PYE03983.1 hypothetical protein BDW31_1372 [Staphylococcus sp. AtHG25]
MADYNTIKDFYEDNKAYLTTDEVLAFERFFDKYRSEDDFIAELDSADADTNFMLTRVERDFSGLKVDLTTEDIEDYLLDLEWLSFQFVDDDFVKSIKPSITSSDLIKVDLKPIGERVYPSKPIVRKRRKQWGGKPTYRTIDLNVKKSKGYAFRSMKRKLPKLDHLSIKETKERMKRSISHIHLKTELTTFETQQSRMELDLLDAYKNFAYYLFELEQEDTAAKKDAWDVAIPAGALDDFIHDTYQPNLMTFANLHSEIKSFIAKEWNEYGERSLKARQQAYGYNLSKEQVDSLQDADKSYMRAMM